MNQILAGASATTGNLDDAIHFQQQAMESGRLNTNEMKDAQGKLSRYKNHQTLRTGKSA